MAVFVLFLILSWSILIRAIDAPPGSDLPDSTRPNCQAACGSVTIPFPFGIGPGCFLNEWYEVICQQQHPNRGIYTPRLKKINFEVLNISLPRFIDYDDIHTREDSVGQLSSSSVLTVSLPIFFSDYNHCSIIQSSDTIASAPLDLPLSLEGSPFVFSQEKNIFTVVGCNHFAMMNNTKSVVLGGCTPNCTDHSSVGSYHYDCLSSDFCCQVTIPSNLQKFSVTFTKIESQIETKTEGCDLAFLIASHTYSIPDQMAKGYIVPGILEWGIANDTDSVKQLPTMFNDTRFDCVQSFHIGNNQVIFNCYCGQGYRGNPYLVNGCQGQNSRKSATASVINNPMLGLVVGIGSIVLLVLAWQLFKIIQRIRKKKLRNKFFQKNGGVLLQQQFSSLRGNFVRSKMFELNELEKATDNFNKDRVLGQGGQGTVYKGMLKDGRIVAIKKSKVMHNEVQRFIDEVLILSQVNHRNIVKLFGCCLESKEPILIYEFIPNGTLYQYLHTPYDEQSISWEIRVRIATEVAGALAYLHGAASIPIYHRDIKSTNILLDELYRAKIADFGTSRSVSLDQTHVTTRVQGTFGYLDPEYFRSSKFTDKSDVYSFGVVLVELLTGQKAVCPIRAQEGKNLATYFIESMENDQLFEIIDPQIQIHNEGKQIVAVADLAIRCLNLYGRQRPTMKEVAMILEGLNKCPQLPLIRDDIQHIEEIHEDYATESSESYDANPIFMTTPFEKIARSTSESGVHSISQASTW